MNQNHPTAGFHLFKAGLLYLTGIVLSGWFFSQFRLYAWMGPAGVLLAASSVAVLIRDFRKSPALERKELLADLLFPPFLILLVLIILAGSLYLPTALDSLSYRIPRMLYWIQEDGFTMIDTPDGRLNLMSPVWEFASTPLYLAGGFSTLWIGSAVAWVILYLAFVEISSNLGLAPVPARWLALLPASSIGFALQAPSTMNDGWSAALIAVSICYILRVERHPRFADVVGSGLALSLAAGAKPHFAVLALPWLLWFFLSKSRPFRVIVWKWAAPLALLALLCSPLPIFVANHRFYGSFMGPAADGGFGFGGLWVNLGLGFVLLLWQIIQPPINPFARSMEAASEKWIGNSGIHEIAPRFGLHPRELQIVDAASIGLVAAVLLGIGFWIVLRKRPQGVIWTRYSAFAALFGILVAVSQVVPGTIGRSFLGFTILVFPLGLAGLAQLSTKRLKLMGGFSMLAGAFALMASPSHPLLPLRSIADRSPKLSVFLKPYFAFQERSHAGKGLLKDLPAEVRELGILANGDQNLIHLWGDREAPRSVRFFPGNANADSVFEQSPDHLVIAGAGEGIFAEVTRQIAGDSRFELVSRQSYSTKSERGAETWSLYRKRNSTR